MKKIQFGKEIVNENKNHDITILKYYLTETPVGYGCSSLVQYGIEIKKTERKPGMQDISECKTIEGIFFNVEEALSFLKILKKEQIPPSKLCQSLEKYIKECITNYKTSSKKTPLSEICR